MEVWYPGRPEKMPASLDREVLAGVLRETRLDSPEVEALYEQFRCLAGTPWRDEVGMAIDRETFNSVFLPNPPAARTAPSVVYDRMFAFYDAENVGVITFRAFAKGVAVTNHKTRDADERLKRVFAGYDFDGDGWVDRGDCVRMFRAYYAVTREMVRDVVASDEPNDLVGVREVLRGRGPVSGGLQGQVLADPRGVGKVGGGDEDGECVREDRMHVLRDEELRDVVRGRGGEEGVEERLAAWRVGEEDGAEVLEQLTLVAIHELLDGIFAEKERVVRERREGGGERVKAYEERRKGWGLGEWEEVEEGGALCYAEWKSAVAADDDHIKLDFVSMWCDLAAF